MSPERALPMHERYHDLLRERNHGDERSRLTALAEELDPATQRRLEALGPRLAWRCLEIGAGTGTIAAWLARRCPRGHVVATDVDLRFLHDGGRRNLEVLEHDVTADDLPPGSFDLIHARYVFAHLRDREDALRRVARWRAPGGWLVLEERRASARTRTGACPSRTRWRRSAWSAWAWTPSARSSAGRGR